MSAKSGGASWRLLNFVPKWARRDATVAPVEDHDVDLSPARPATSAETDTFNLDVNEFADAAIADVNTTGVGTLAGVYEPATGFAPLLAGLAEDTRKVRAEYVAKAGEVLAKVAERFAELLEAVKDRINPATKLRGMYASVLTEKVVRFCDVRGQVEEGARKLRRLQIQITGSPEKNVNLGYIAIKYWVMAAFASLVLALEFGINMPVLQGVSSRETGALVSIGASFVTVVCLFFAAEYRQKREMYQNALVENRRYYSGKLGGKDPVLNERVEVAPLNAGHAVRYWSAHFGMFAIPLFLIAMRTFAISRQLHPNWGGGLAGSIVVLVVTLGAYLVEISLPGTPQGADEYKKTREDNDALAKSVAVLGNPVSEEGEFGVQLTGAWATYGNEVDALVREDNTSGLTGLKKTAVRLRGQLDVSANYFIHAFNLNARVLADSIREVHKTGTFEVPEHPETTFPELVTPAIDTAELDKVAAFEPPKVERLRDWRELAREIWRDALAAHERHLAASKEADALRAAEQRRIDAIDARNNYVPRVVPSGTTRGRKDKK